MADFVTDHYTVRELFSEDFVFEFPFYQRPYRWSPEHAATLLDDLLSACTAIEPLVQLPPYFLGSIVLVRRDDDDRHVDVIDGRQRLTTLAILLAVLRDTEPRGQLKADLHEMLFDDRSEIRDIEPGPRLRTKGLDSDFISTWLNSSGATLVELAEDEMPEKAARLYAVMQLFRRRLNNLSEGIARACATSPSNTAKSWSSSRVTSCRACGFSRCSTRADFLCRTSISSRPTF